MRVHEGYELEGKFLHDYAVEVLIDQPTARSISRFGSGSGAILKIYPKDGIPFIFTVAERLRDLRLLSMPDPGALLIMPGGLVVDTNDPGASALVPITDGHGLHYVHAHHAPDVLLVGHCCAITCYGREGLLWTRRLFDRDPEIKIAGSILTMQAGSDFGVGEIVVDLLTGEGI